MDDTTILGSALGQLGQTVKQAAKQVVKLPEELGKDAGEQLGSVRQNDRQAASAPLSGASGEPKQWQSDEERIKFLKDLYGPTDAKQKPPEQKPSDNKTSASPLASSSQEKPSEFQEQIKDKAPEEQKALVELRNQLHREVYYDPTFNRPKQQEERPAEKVENEKKQEMAELQQKDAKKPTNWAVKREQNKAEMFRGASG